MGKNRNRNRRNKKNNTSLEPNEKTLSSPKTNNNALSKNEVSFNINCTLKFPEIYETQNRLKSLSISDSISEGASCSKHSKEISTELKKLVKEEKCTGISTEKIVPNLTRKAKPFVESRYNNKVQHDIGSDYFDKAKPRIEYDYKHKSYINNNYHVKKPQASVKNNLVPAPFYHNETIDETRFRSDHPDRRISTASVPKMTGARPKIESRFGNSTLNDDLKIKQEEKNSQLFKQKIQGGVSRYENHWDNFNRLYHSWRGQREKTIKNLQDLVEKVHKDQRMFNQGNVFLKELNVESREVKNCNSSPTVDFLASLAAFVTDAASGITSVVQACNVDIYCEAFKEIMENDAKITKPLHAARSRCLEEYENVEEIIRQCHLETFSSTIDNISNTLNVEDLLSDIKNAKGEDTVGQVIDSVGLFLKRNANMEIMGEVYNSIHDCLDSNPAALEACKSAGKALYGVYDTWGRDHKQGRASIAGNVSIISNKMMLIEERRELSELRSVAENDQESQAKLESKIDGAISSLQSEMREINNIFERKNQTHGSSSWYF